MSGPADMQRNKCNQKESVKNMAEPSNNPNPNPDPKPNDPPANDPPNPAPPADPKANQDPSNQTVQLTDEQLKAAFEHPRFKELTQAAKRAKELEEQQKQRDEDEAKKRGEFEQLAEKYKTEASTVREQLQTERANNKIMAVAVQEGITDADAAIKLIDRSSIKVNEDGSIEGVEDAVKALAESKPYLKSGSTNQTNIGSPSNPNPEKSGTPPAYTGSQVKDTKFYLENQKEIDKAVGEGRVDWSK